MQLFSILKDLGMTLLRISKTQIRVREEESVLDPVVCTNSMEALEKGCLNLIYTHTKPLLTKQKDDC